MLLLLLLTEIRAEKWDVLRGCPLRGQFYQCSGPKYEEHLERHVAPALDATIGGATKVLFYGPSYLRQLFLEVICLYYANGMIDDDEVAKFTNSSSQLDPVRTITLKTNATITSVINAAQYQNSTSAFALYGLLHDLGVTHGFFMEPHADCFFRNEKCMPTTESKREPTSAEIAHQCLLRKIFTHYFDPRHNRAWLHVLAWCGLWTNRSDLSLCTEDKANVLDTAPLVQAPRHNGLGVCSQRAPRSTDIGTCGPTPYGHLCAPGHISSISLTVWNTLFPPASSL